MSARPRRRPPRPDRAGGRGKRVLGILGGMGPLATADFMQKIIELTPAAADADHIPLIVISVPQIPDRVRPILEGRGPSPLPALLERLAFLEAAGAGAIAMPCATAHYWYDALAGACRVPFLSMVEAVAAAVRERRPKAATVGLIGTAATVEAGFFQARLAADGCACLVPDAALIEAAVAPGIALVKKGRLAEAAPLFRRAIDRLMAAGASPVILACTEIPPALAGDDEWTRRHCVDATAALARTCVDWALGGADR